MMRMISVLGDSFKEMNVYVSTCIAHRSLNTTHHEDCFDPGEYMMPQAVISRSWLVLRSKYVEGCT